MADFHAEGGGVHPGKPIIWPTGKPTSSSSTSSTQSNAAQNAANQTAPVKPGQVAPAQQAAATASPAAAAPAKTAASISRNLTIEDVRSHLLSLQIEPSDFNSKLASMMLRNGLELSRGNFVKILNMMQGTNKSDAMQQAATMLVMKGVDSPEAVKVLGQYLAENPSMASQISGLQSGIGNLASALASGKGLLNSTLVAQLTAMLGQFDDMFQTISDQFATKGTSLDRSSLLTDAKALKALLNGVKEKAGGEKARGAQGEILASAVKEFTSKLDRMMQNVVAQSILSQSGRTEVNYHYQQIPNTMVNPPKDFEIVIKRDGEGKKAKIDPRNTQVVMAFETDGLGKMVISMIVKDNKIYVVFVFAEKDYGDNGRALIAQEFGEFQKKLSDKNFLITGYQVKVDKAMCNTKAYLIPLLPSIENALKRIDIEA
ncbi:hypothetical protein A3K48_07660 [candidate division WOR-1 bacterium RIFOXYA12_FULL_52_29]|uniref:Flagellar hook-length control protein-like C-terminal domain-containing protein n=1 Tax=candidate division WOR-1 bacterium RIFOXYC12_FULL_54_18 TaxID=1802584 RepID=A0A1F4T9Q6_UNCSA|nr:MAG: hypothetical protein A3K44_07660 [candidate division WOR-1 bacterium RIFOXYA2_FULL_51_19]OGC18386.1 MAG: hypothetical protein A3K48_07660 [candidate division WOR-1 bacterium RIFOXYA12_FULL_52_29]OGC27241.1 MAG: hypothetical protein A3K32_07655 [candidate division WOR-1 bacterium RIFOXYB2_FULL_45_9]OGC28803.1 MAG: hypothetical protein A3K49_07660 [candidate division WOR-1 bacterium RIFOXYC12_FULL_54_18]OGC30743.1 MAG: hypothetical protein A2346_04955 [candidate division WOR-1 bacterium R